MANVMSQSIDRTTARSSAPLELDKAGVMLGFLVGMVLMLAYQHGVEGASAGLSVALVAASTWVGLKAAQALGRLMR